MLVLWQDVPLVTGSPRSPIWTTSTATTWRPPARRAGSPATPTAASSPTPPSPASRWPSSWCGPWAGRQTRSSCRAGADRRGAGGFSDQERDLRRRPSVRGPGRLGGALQRRRRRPAQARGRHHPGAVLPGGLPGRTQHPGSVIEEVRSSSDYGRQDPRGHRSLPCAREGHGLRLARTASSPSTTPAGSSPARSPDRSKARPRSQSVSACQLATTRARSASRWIWDATRPSGSCRWPSEDKGYRIVVDIFRRVDGPDGDGPPLICIDPGHGGDDTGAIGAHGYPGEGHQPGHRAFLAEDLRRPACGS